MAQTVMCKYHGWRFEPCSGRCEEIPSLTSHDHLEPTRIYANSYPVREQDGYAWVYVPAAGAGRVLDESRASGRAGAAEVHLAVPFGASVALSCLATWITALSG